MAVRSGAGILGVATRTSDDLKLLKTLFETRFSETPIPDVYGILSDFVGMVRSNPDLDNSTLAHRGLVMFLDVFSGREFSIVGPMGMIDAVRDARIYQDLGPQGTREARAADLAQEYGISAADVNRIFDDVSRQVKDYRR